MITAEKITGKDVYVVDFTHLDGIGDLEGDVFQVKFANADDESDRLMFADQKTCTVVVGEGADLEDEATVTDENGASVSGSVTFGA
jgi:hypothetical protein